VKGSDYIVDFLIGKGVTDVFGISGGVLLDFLDSLAKKKDKIRAHLNYHEQASAFAACGYARITGKLGVAYATKGPGMTNLITGITEAFFDSVPVLFITGHSNFSSLNVRFEGIQELDSIKMISSVTKYAMRITDQKDLRYHLEYAYYEATNGRPGPVFLDIAVNLFKSVIKTDIMKPFNQNNNMELDSNERIIKRIRSVLKEAKRPLLLIGDGIHQSKTESHLRKFVESLGIPVLSSLVSQDLIPDSEYYFGFIGSHATRYSNFILSKCDVVISLGNRMAYNVKSKSFEIFNNKLKIYIDIDKNEFGRNLPNAEIYPADISSLLPAIAGVPWHNMVDEEWIRICTVIKNTLIGYDIGYPIELVSNIFKVCNKDVVIVGDVGKNMLWLSHAYSFAKVKNRVLFSKSFAVLGCSLPKAIGAYYATRERVLCFTGDAGLQMNIQEFQFIAHENIPITIIILNNSCPGDIRKAQKKKFNSNFFHSTIYTGYSMPNFKLVAEAFSISYCCITNINELFTTFDFSSDEKPSVIEIKIEEDTDSFPDLPIGRPCQDFDPRLDRGMYGYLNDL
jgi:acetolactate synthase-1/2/3 large subunit